MIDAGAWRYGGASELEVSEQAIQKDTMLETCNIDGLMSVERMWREHDVMKYEKYLANIKETGRKAQRVGRLWTRDPGYGAVCVSILDGARIAPASFAWVL